jgi:hypothetical protein
MPKTPDPCIQIGVLPAHPSFGIVEHAAWQSGTALYDRRMGFLCAREAEEGMAALGIEENGILAPKGAPTWALDPNALWNAVDKRAGEEHRGAIAREGSVILPPELPREQQRELVRTFLQEQFVSRGMVADYVLCTPPTRALFLLTAHEIREHGFGKRLPDTQPTPDQLRAGWSAALDRTRAAARIEQRRCEHSVAKNKGLGR